MVGSAKPLTALTIWRGPSLSPARGATVRVVSRLAEASFGLFAGSPPGPVALGVSARFRSFLIDLDSDRFFGSERMGPRFMRCTRPAGVGSEAVRCSGIEEQRERK